MAMGAPMAVRQWLAQQARRGAEKLQEMSYFIASEEIPLAKFPGLVHLDKHHDVCVSLGSTYITRQMCSYFTKVIVDTMREPVINTLMAADYSTPLIDGSTDASNTEKELMYTSSITKVVVSKYVSRP
eukprot:scpid99914/ scgid23021/ 